jgi:hypothetical protein
VEWLMLLVASQAVVEVWQLTSGQGKICYSHGDVTIMGPCVQGVDTIPSDL